MSFYRKEYVKRTRDDCRCDWCGEYILSGESSIVAVGVYEGDFNQSRYHPECDHAITRFCDANNCWGEELPPHHVMNRGGIMEKGEPENQEIDT